MATLDQLQVQLDSLKKARASGLRSVEYSGRRQEYKSDGEMATAIGAIEREIADVAGNGIVRQFRFVSCKAL